MTNFASPKDLLLHYGKIEKIGRGRISAGNHAFIAERIAAGDKVGGYEAKVSTKPTGEKVHSNATAPVAGEKVISDITYRFPIDTPAHLFYGGKKFRVSMREACRNCRVSLVQCHCGRPEVVAPDGRTSVRVYIEGDAVE